MHIPGARVSVGMFWGCTWEGRRQVAGGRLERDGEWGVLSTERVKFLASVRGGGARIKGLLFSVSGCRQLPPPCSCQCRPPLLASLLVCGPGPGPPPVPPGPKQQALSPQPPPTCKPLTLSVSPAGSSAERHTQPLFFPLPKPLMEEGRPRSSLSLASSASTISSLGSLSTKVRASWWGWGGGGCSGLPHPPVSEPWFRCHPRDSDCHKQGSLATGCAKPSKVPNFPPATARNSEALPAVPTPCIFLIRSQSNSPA